MNTAIMKKNIYITLTLLVGIISMGYSQKVKTSDLKGTWSLNYTTTLASLDAMGQAKYEALPEATKDHLEAGMNGLMITFDPNGTYHLSSPEGDEIDGSWDLDENSAMLEITLPDGRKSEQYVQGLSADNLILRVEELTNSKVVFHRWYLDKQ